MTMEVEELMCEYHAAKEKLSFFDGSCWAGIDGRGEFFRVSGLEELYNELRRGGIKQAIVSNSFARNYDPVVGNEILMKKLQGYDCLFGAAVLIPGLMNRSQFRRYVETLIAGKIRMIRLFPVSHNFLLSDWYAGESLSILEELNLSVIMLQTEVSWNEVDRLCSDYPRINVIIEGAGRKLFYDNRIYYRLLEKHPNFYLYTHNLVNYLGLDSIVARFGSANIIFGTNFPTQDINTSTMLITHGSFSVEDKRRIACGNLKELINKVSVRELL